MESKEKKFTVDILIQNIVATTAYPDIGPIFVVSTFWRKREDQQIGEGQTVVFGPCDLNGNGGTTLWEGQPSSWCNCLLHNRDIVTAVKWGEIELVPPDQEE